jgi:uncharacterized damage-inducible protein DinB
MPDTPSMLDRRQVIKTGLVLAATGFVGLPLLSMAGGSHPAAAAPTLEGLYMIGPREGYSPYIGSLVSMMEYNRSTIIGLTKDMTMEQLDHLQDPQSNTIGALLMHLAAVDWFYYNHCFGDAKNIPKDEQAFWDPAMNLGDKGRQSIKGKELSFYTDLLKTTREKTLANLKTKDDQWLLSEDPIYSSKDTKLNNYWCWFHVCEHESHHRGQMAWLKKRVPGIKAGDD